MRSRWVAVAAFLAVATSGHTNLAAAARVKRNTAGLDAACPVPHVEDMDQSPSNPADYGRCTSAVEEHVKNSNWCTFDKLGFWPGGPSKKAKRCMKFGRMTVYRGPVYGNDANHKGACNADLVGSDEAAMVAVSTKYLSTEQHGWSGDKGACGRCMCIHIRGVDDKYNPGVRKRVAKQHFGLTFLGKVGDRCGECEDEHIDVLLDRPLGYAPYDPEIPNENRHAPHANSRPGARGFANPWSMRAGDMSPETVGTWVADWQWVPCAGWSHARCGEMMRGVGYDQVLLPQPTSGVDSVTMRKVDHLIGGRPWAEAVPLRHFNYPTPTVPARAMCGGSAEGCKLVKTNKQCEDAQWAECPAGHRCTRDSEYWWSCVPQEEVHPVVQT